MNTINRLPRAERSARMRNERERKILEAAIEEAKRVGCRNFTRREIAARAGVADGSVNHAFGTLDALRDAVMRAAVAREIVSIIRQGLADGHPVAHSAPPGLIQLAMQPSPAG